MAWRNHCSLTVNIHVKVLQRTDYWRAVNLCGTFSFAAVMQHYQGGDTCPFARGVRWVSSTPFLACNYSWTSWQLNLPLDYKNYSGPCEKDELRGEGGTRVSEQIWSCLVPVNSNLKTCYCLNILIATVVLLSEIMIWYCGNNNYTLHNDILHQISIINTWNMICGARAKNTVTLKS